MANGNYDDEDEESMMIDSMHEGEEEERTMTDAQELLGSDGSPDEDHEDDDMDY